MNCKTLNSPTNVCIVFPTLFQFSLDHFENHLFQNQKKEWAARNTVSHFTCEIKRFQGFDRLLISNVQGCSFQVALDFMKVRQYIYIYIVGIRGSQPKYIRNQPQAKRKTAEPNALTSLTVELTSSNCWPTHAILTQRWRWESIFHPGKFVGTPRLHLQNQLLKSICTSKFPPTSSSVHRSFSYKSKLEM